MKPFDKMPWGYTVSLGRSFWAKELTCHRVSSSWKMVVVCLVGVHIFDVKSDVLTTMSPSSTRVSEQSGQGHLGL